MKRSKELSYQIEMLQNKNFDVLNADFISKKLKELSILAEMNREIHATIRVERLLQVLVEKAVIGVNFERGLVYLLKDNFLQCVAFLDRSKKEEAALIRKLVGFRMDETSAEVLAAKMGKTMYMEHADSDPRVSKKFLRVTNTREYCVVPLIGRQGIWGVLTGDKFYSGDPIYPEDIETLQLFAEHISLAIENASFYEEKENLNQRLEEKVIARTSELSHINQELSTLYNMSQLLTQSLHENTVSSQILDLVYKLGYPACSLHIVHEHSQQKYRFIGLEENEANHIEPLVNNIASYGEDAQFLLLPDSKSSELPYYLRVICKERAFQSIFLVPIHSKSLLTAILTVYAREPLIDTEKLKRFFSAFARQAGAALENAFIFQDMLDEKNQIESRTRRLEWENINLKRQMKFDNSEGFVHPKSKPMIKIMGLVQKVASTDATVLLYGETGTGKEVIVKQIHKNSFRSGGPLITVNCTAIPDELIEGELFGHEKGAFTGAHQKRIGLFELANEGSIFLDEIGEVPLKTQTKLLRVLQEQEIQPLGSRGPKKIDVRVIAATNKDLRKLVEENSFRSDLYFRLNVFPLTIPPLRDRKEDIKELIQFFLQKYGHNCKYHQYFKMDIIDVILRYDWPGNVRELENVIERILIMVPDRPVELDDLPKEITHNASSNLFNMPMQPLPEAMHTFKKNMVVQALGMTGGKKSAAAALLGLQRSNFSRLLKNLGLR